MRAAAQASASGYQRGGGGGRPGSMLGRLGPATSLGLAGVGFPTLDSSRGASSVRESTVLDAAQGAAAERAQGGAGEPHLNLLPFMSLAPHTVRPKTPADTGGRGRAAPPPAGRRGWGMVCGEECIPLETGAESCHAACLGPQPLAVPPPPQCTTCSCPCR